METNTFQIKGGVGRLPTPRSYTPTPRPNDNYTCRHVYLVHWQVARMYSLNFARTLRYNRIRIPFFFCFLFLFFSTVIFRLTSFSQRKIIASTSRWICMNVDERIEKALREHFLFFPFWVQIFLIFPSFFLFYSVRTKECSNPLWYKISYRTKPFYRNEISKDFKRRYSYLTRVRCHCMTRYIEVILVIGLVRSKDAFQCALYRCRTIENINALL